MPSTSDMLEISDERELFFFLNIAIKKGQDINTERWGMSIDGLKKAVFCCFQNEGAVQFQQTILEIKKECSLLDERYLTWLKNPAACFFTWVYINHIELGNSQQSDVFKSWRKTFRQIYGIPDSYEQRYHSIVGYFDCIEDSPVNKIEIINSINRMWNLLKVKDKYNRWIDASDRELCEWLWNSLLSEGTASYDITISHPGEIHYAIMAVLQAWPCEPVRPKEMIKAGVHLISREAALTKLHKTWMQRKYREKLQLDDLSLSQPIRKKLHFIHRKMGVSPEGIISEFIEKTYLSIKANI
ncbi:hypothetical protein [Citrobacter braakii]|uniref:hypothetical protein n=1 Tax=Citrobacter braakii TaxID=57706 RepID=UPI003D9606F3